MNIFWKPWKTSQWKELFINIGNQMIKKLNLKLICKELFQFKWSIMTSQKNVVQLQMLRIKNYSMQGASLKLFQEKEVILSNNNLISGSIISESFQLDAAHLPKVAIFQLIMLFTQLDLFGTVMRIKVFW